MIGGNNRPTFRLMISGPRGPVGPSGKRARSRSHTQSRVKRFKDEQSLEMMMSSSKSTSPPLVQPPIFSPDPHDPSFLNDFISSPHSPPTFTLFLWDYFPQFMEQMNWKTSLWNKTLGGTPRGTEDDLFGARLSSSILLAR